MSQTTPDMMCRGQGCDFKSVCFRFKAIPGIDQKYFDKSPMRTWFNEKGYTKGRNYICEESWTLHEDRPEYIALSNAIKEEDELYFKNKKKGSKYVH